MTVKLLMFIVLVQAVLFVMHLVFFRSIIHFFGITAPGLKLGVYALMTALAVSFLSAFLLLRLHGSPGAVFYYRAAAVWTGFLIHFLSAAAAVWIVILVCRWVGIAVNRPLIAGAFLAVAVLFSIYGMWNAFYPRVREVRVPLRQVPEYWKNRRIVQLSDVHLGHLHGRAFAERLVRRVNDLDPDLILITGDLLDGVSGPYAEAIQPIQGLSARHGVFFVTGNHEHYVGVHKALAIIRQTPLRVLDNEWVAINGLELVGVSYPGIERLSDIRDLPRTKSPDHTRLLLFHTPTTIQKATGDLARRHTRTYWRPDTAFVLNRQTGADLQLSGHTHHGQIFPLQWLTRLLFGGYDYGLKRDGDFQVYTSCGTGTWGPPVRTAGRSEITVIRFTEGP